MKNCLLTYTYTCNMSVNILKKTSSNMHQWFFNLGFNVFMFSGKVFPGSSLAVPPPLA